MQIISSAVFAYNDNLFFLYLHVGGVIMLYIYLLFVRSHFVEQETAYACSPSSVERKRSN